MKRLILAGAVGLGLVACGPSGSDVDPIVNPPDATSPYTPAPSAVESSDPRVPYLGDWAWVVRRPDGTYRQGVLSVTSRGRPTDQAKNGGVGEGYLCRDDTCEVRYDASYGVINSFIMDGQAYLGAVYGDLASTTTPPTNRLGILDADSQVSVDGQKQNAVIAGTGTWVEVTGQPGESVRAAFVQMDTLPADDVFGVPRAEAFAQARAAAEAVVTPQRANGSSLLRLPRMEPVRR